MLTLPGESVYEEEWSAPKGTPTHSLCGKSWEGVRSQKPQVTDFRFQSSTLDNLYFVRYILSTYYVSGRVLTVGDTGVIPRLQNTVLSRMWIKSLASSLGQVFPLTSRDVLDLGLEANLCSSAERNTYIALACERVYMRAFGHVRFSLFCVCVFVSQCMGECVCASVYMCVCAPVCVCVCACAHCSVPVCVCVYVAVCMCEAHVYTSVCVSPCATESPRGGLCVCMLLFTDLRGLIHAGIPGGWVLTPPHLPLAPHGSPVYRLPITLFIPLPDTPTSALHLILWTPVTIASFLYTRRPFSASFPQGLCFLLRPCAFSEQVLRGPHLSLAA